MAVEVSRIGQDDSYQKSIHRIEQGKITNVSNMNTWRGLGGRKPSSISGVEFDKQLDKLSLWVEEWDHDTRCNIIEGLLSRSNHNQIQFLWTVTQPALHRDFMYTAIKEFPNLQFTPISTYQTRRSKEKAKRMYRKHAFHRVQSAYIQHLEDAKNASKEKDLPNIDLLAIINRDREDTRLTHRSHVAKGTSSLPKITNAEYTRKQEQLHMAVGLNAVQGQRSGWDVIKSAPPTLSDEEPQNVKDTSQFIEMPVRRHIQEEGTTNIACTSLSKLTGKKKKQNKNKVRSKTDIMQSTVPLEAWRLYHWYEEQWPDVQRNEFLHKLLLKLDPRQHYFISSYLAVKQYRDFISLLPEKLALKIFDYLSPSGLLVATKVNKTWYCLANHNSLWKSKCNEVTLEIPIPRDPRWKKVYRDNIKVKENWRNARCQIIECKGHSQNVLSLCFDRRRIASGSSDSTIRIWDIKTGKHIQTLKGHTKGVWCVSFFTRNLLISGSYDSTMRIWNLSQGVTVRTILGHDGPIWCLCRKGNTVVTGCQDKKARVWDISRSLLLRKLTGHHAAIFSVDMDEDGETAVTGSADRSVRIWTVESGECRKIIWVSQTTSVMSVSYSHGFIACCYSDVICLYRADSSKLLKTYQEHQKRVECVQLKITDVKRGKGVIMSSGQDGALKYWDTLQSSRSIQSFQGHGDKSVTCLRFDELRIASASHDHKVKIWDFSV